MHALLCADMPPEYHLYNHMTCIYPIIIFAVYISSIFNKGFHCELLAFSNCNLEGSSLIERLRERTFKTYYSGTPLKQTPLGNKILAIEARCL